MSKRSLPKIPKKKILLALAIVLVIVAVGISQPILWPGGFGIGKEQSITTKSVETVVKDAQGNTTKTVETTKNDDGKTLWDWLSLLGVPVSLAVLGYILQQLQQKRAEVLAKEQREIAADETKEEVLQVYFDRLSVLLVDKNLLAIAAKKDQATDEERELLASAMDVVRARTLSILRRFENDRERKTSVIQFLLEANIISELKLNLRFADLSCTNIGEANLEGANLNKINLSNANLIYANLSNANLGGANLSDADCCFANLSNANLEGANLRGANLNKANLSNTNLSNTNLSNAQVTAEQLETSKLCKTTLPEKITTDPDRDCKALGTTGN
jgi:Pentapeptide repeats (8 copies)